MLYKRTANASEFFGDYAPYAPKRAAEYKTDIDTMVDNAMHGPLNVHDKFNPNAFQPIKVTSPIVILVGVLDGFCVLQGPYGNFTLQEFVNLAEHLITSSSNSTLTSADGAPASDAIVFDEDSPSFIKNHFGTAKANVSGAVREKVARKKRSATVNLTDASFVPLDVSNYTKPSRLDVVLPEFIVDHVEAFNSSQSETDRAEAHQKLQQHIDKAVEALKRLQDSYKHLYEQINLAKSHFPADDPAHKSLDEILASAVAPSSILPDDSALLTSNSNPQPTPT